MEDQSPRSSLKNISPQHQRKAHDPQITTRPTTTTVPTPASKPSSPPKSPRKSADDIDSLTRKVDIKAIIKYEHEIENIQNTIMKQLQDLREQHDDLLSLVMCNEDNMLTVYKLLGQISGYMANLSKSLQAQAFPVELYRNYTVLSEVFQKLIGKLQGYRSTSEGFAAARSQLLSQNMRITAELQQELGESIHSSTDSLEMRMPEAEQQQPQPRKTQRDNQMTAEILRLEKKLKDDNEQFVIQIKKYNSILYQMQGDIDRLQQQLTITQVKYSEIEQQNNRIKQQKIRDELIINNLTKKLRAGRHSSNLSPHPTPNPRSIERTTTNSPTRMFMTDRQGGLRRLYSQRRYYA